jgi:hypothetical protein
MNIFDYFGRIGTIKCISLETKQLDDTKHFDTANVIQYTLFGYKAFAIYCTRHRDRYRGTWCDYDGKELSHEYRWAVDAYTTNLETIAEVEAARAQIVANINAPSFVKEEQ